MTDSDGNPHKSRQENQRESGAKLEEADSGRTPEMIDQYGIYVDTALNVSNRRMRNNRFYVVLLSGTLAVISVLAETEIIEAAGLLISSSLGFALCVLWYLSIVSYKQLNSGKYEVIHSMEENLPLAPFTQEWEVLDEGDNPQTYITHTWVERKIPWVLAVPYAIISVFSSLQLI